MSTQNEWVLMGKNAFHKGWTLDRLLKPIAAEQTAVRSLLQQGFEEAAEKASRAAVRAMKSARRERADLKVLFGGGR